MKFIFYRKFFGLILLAVGWSAIYGANTMTISSTSMGPYQNFSVTVDISNSNSFVAFQFDLPLPAGFSYVAGSVALNPLRINGHMLDASMIPGNKLRVVGYSNSNVPFVGNSGPVVSFQLKAGAVPGSYPLILETPLIGDTNTVNILTGITNGMATLLAPDIHITTSLLDFIRTPLGSYTDKTLTISNTGNQPLNITGITFTSSYFSVVGSSVFTIAAGQSQNIQVRFTSLVKGVYDKKMTISCNDPDEATQQVSLHARAYAVNELHTGDLFAYSGKQGTLTFTINNMEPITGFQFDLVLPSPLTYAAGTASLSVRKGNHLVSVNTIPGNKLRVVAHSPTGQVFSGTAGSVLTLSFNVKGIGGGYGLNLQNVIIGDTLGENSLSDSYNGTLNVAAPDISSSSQLSFGNVSILETSQKTLRIYNYGSDTLKIEQISLSNPSYTLGTDLPLNVMSSTYQDVMISFHQTTRGQSNGMLKVFSNDPDEYPYNVSLSANAYVPNYISIPNMSAKYIDTVTVPVKINNLDAVVGFQFDLDFPTCMHYLQNSEALTSRMQGYTVLAENLGPTKLRVIAFSPARSPLVGDTGIALSLRFTIHATFNQPSLDLLLSEGVLGNILMENVLWGMNNGIINIISLPSTVYVNGTLNPGQQECHNATQVITVAGNGSSYLIPGGASATFIAGERILFLPGTSVLTGGNLLGKITLTGQYCGMQYPIGDSIGSIEEKTGIDTKDIFYKIYPNPTNGTFVFELIDNRDPVEINVEIYSIQGIKVLSRKLVIDRSYEFSLSEQRSGIYLINAAYGKRIQQVKIIKR